MARRAKASAPNAAGGLARRRPRRGGLSEKPQAPASGGASEPRLPGRRIDRILFLAIAARWTGAILPFHDMIWGRPPWPDERSLAQSDISNTIINALILLGGGYALVRLARIKPDVFLKYKFHFLFLIFVCASIYWSILPAVSDKRALAYTANIIMVIYFVQTLSVDYMTDVLFKQLLFTSILSVIVRFIFKDYGLYPGTHDLRGVYEHKNVLGEAMAAATLFALYRLMRMPNFDLRRAGYVAWFFGVTLLSLSSTSIVVAFASITVAALIGLTSRPGTRVLGIFGTVVLAFLFVVFLIAPDFFFGLLGKDATLTGRTDLWPHVFDEIAKRPWFGWGFNAFWLGDNPEAEAVWKAIGWVAPHAHNALFELMIELGYVGTAMFLCAMVVGVVAAWKNLRAGEYASGMFGLAGALSLMIWGATEGAITTAETLQLAYFLSAIQAINVCRQLKPKKQAVAKPLRGPAAAPPRLVHPPQPQPR